MDQESDEDHYDYQDQFDHIGSASLRFVLAALGLECLRDRFDLLLRPLPAPSGLASLRAQDATRDLRIEVDRATDLLEWHAVGDRVGLRLRSPVAGLEYLLDLALVLGRLGRRLGRALG